MQVAAEMRRRLQVRPRLAWRYALGWTQEKLALEFRLANPSIPIATSRVSEWENWPYGSGGRLTLEILGALAVTFGNGCGVRNLFDEIDLDHFSPGERQWLQPERRPQHADGLKAPRPAPAARLQLAVAAVSSPHAAAMESFRRADQQVGGGHLYGTVLTYLNSTLARDLLAVGRSDASPFTAAAALSEMAGWMAHDAGDDVTARDHFARAIQLAAVDGDAQVTAHVLGSAAHLALLQADVEHARTLATRGLQAASDHALPGVLRARLLGMQARAAAAQGDIRGSLASLSQAETEIQRPGTVEVSPWVSPFDEASLAMDAARSLLTGGDLAGARERAEQVLALRPAERARARALGQLLLATALLESGRGDQAASLAADALVSTAHLCPLDQDVAEVELRRAWIASLDVDAAKLDYLDSAVEWIIDHDERLPATQLRARARELHEHVHRLLLSPQHPPARHRLYTLAAHLAGVQAALALDLGRIRLAHAYAQEAFDLADAGDVPDVVAWARAAQSLVSYYDGQYLDALAYAQDGLNRAPHGIHAVRLAVNGQARSLAKIGDHDAAARAVDHACTVLDRHDPPHHDLTASLTTGIYCTARTAGNAATAFLSLGDTAQVEHHAALALATFDRTHTPGTQAMTRLDLATALLEPGARDIERATTLVREALAVSAVRPFPVQQRAIQFLQAAAPWQSLPAIKDVRELVAEPAPHPLEDLV